MRKIDPSTQGFRILRMIWENHSIAEAEILAAFPGYTKGSLRNMLLKFDVHRRAACAGGEYFVPALVAYQVRNLVRKLEQPEDTEPGIPAGIRSINVLSRPPMKCGLASVLAAQSNRLKVR